MYQVMIVDDYEILRRKIRYLPIWKRFSEFQIVAEAENGEEALDILKEKRVQIVLTDIQMPFMDGIELLRKIQNEKLADCVILLSEDRKFEYAYQGLILGAFDYLIKPVEEETLEHVLNRAVEYLEDGKKTDILPAERELALFCVEDKAGISESCLRTFVDKIETEQKNKKKDLDFSEIYTDVVEKIKQEISWTEYVIPRQDKFYTAIKEKKKVQEQREVFNQGIRHLHRKIHILHPLQKSDLVCKVCDLVLNHPQKKYCLAEISDHFFVNKTYLSHQFKQETGNALTHYIALFKVECAKKMLLDTAMSSVDIAEYLGYENARYFTQIFRKIVGKTMAEYRK